jgi:HD-GYP domain-containing protein (c-di-GMP phosphodiesterase class II)
MDIRLDILSRKISNALDIIEGEMIGVSEYHSLRTAVLCAAIGQELGFDDDSLSALAVCALFHDNSLTEYLLSETPGENQPRNIRLHCEYGQRNVEWLPFKKDISGFVLYHHERADGSGAFGKKEGGYPLEAGLIALADSLDVHMRLGQIPVSDLPKVHAYLKDISGTAASGQTAALMAEVIDEEMLLSLQNDRIHDTIEKAIPVWTVSPADPIIMRIARMVARVIDYKSAFTRKHTKQIAYRSWVMSEYYGYDLPQRAQLYLAAGLHDIGKIATPIGVLEKPGSLTPEEFAIIKKHVYYTHLWLKDIPGLEDIARWAADHHETLDGKGYSFGKPAEELDFNARLLACIDIYQAVSEERPYHPTRSHEDTIPILYSMADKGKIDPGIVKDMDIVMAEYSNRDLPPPEMFGEEDNSAQAYARDGFVPYC